MFSPPVLWFIAPGFLARSSAKRLLRRRGALVAKRRGLLLGDGGFSSGIGSVCWVDVCGCWFNFQDS